MLIVQFPAHTAPVAQAKARSQIKPEQEEWQPDGTWTGLFDMTNEQQEEFNEMIEEIGGEGTKIREVENKDDIGGHRMALYAFN
jgi:ribosome maturation protein Sdo1